MGDKATLAKARMELEAMYEGIPDESVNLTFQDFADLKLNQISSEKKKPTPILERFSELKSPSPLAKIPSLDFNRALQASHMSNNHHNNHMNHANIPHRPHHQNHHFDDHHEMNDHHGHGGYNHHQMHHHGHESHGTNNHHMNMSSHGSVPASLHSNMSSSGPTCQGSGMRHGLETSMGAFDHDVSGVSMASMYQQDRGGRRRPGIPHSNVCTICSTSIYIFRHRCLVCGRVYCRKCVMVGMGEMTEGRKCVECLGRRFSQRYIQRAGKVGCCSRYPSSVKQAELKWAEKGPRRSGNGPYGRSTMKSPISRSPLTPVTPRTPSSSNPSSFVMSSSHSPYSPTLRHHLPF